MINKWIYTTYLIVLALFPFVVKLLTILNFPDYSGKNGLIGFLVQNMLLPAYILWRLYNYFIRKEKFWLPQFNGRKRWYVTMGLCFLWLMVVLVLVTLLIITTSSPAAMLGIVLIPIIMMCKYFPVIFIEVGYLVLRKEIPNSGINEVRKIYD